MLVLSGGQAETLFDLALPVEVMDLPEDLAGIDRLLDDPAVLAPIDAAWTATGRGVERPTIPMDRLVRLMVIKSRSGWGYETLVKEVSDSLHLRRFCRIALTEWVPDESTIRKLVRRLGPEVIEEIVMVLIGSVTQQGTPARFQVRAVRIDSTVVESDVRFPTDIELCADATKILAHEANKVRDLAGNTAPRVRDRSRSITQRVRKLNRTFAARTGQGKETAVRLTGEAEQLAAVSVREARRLLTRLRERGTWPRRATQARCGRPIGGAHRQGREGV